MTDLTIQTSDKGIGIYIRSGSDQTCAICKQLDRAYGGHSILTTSGIHAISTVTKYAIMKNNWKKLNIICGDEMYCDTTRVFREMGKLYTSIEYNALNVNNDADIIRAVTNSKNYFTMIFLESCTNPSGEIVNFDIIKTLKHINPNILVVIDNTWLTRVILNPFKYGADIVVQSMSKHYSGGNCISGAVIAKNMNVTSYIADMYRFEGIHFSVTYGDIISENLQSLDYRIQRLSDTTKKVLQFLNDKAPDIKLIHPYIKTHNSHSKLVKYFKNDLVPGIILISLNIPENIAIKIMKCTPNIQYKTSFGGSSTKFDPWPFKIDNSTFCRLAIGYDDTYEEIEKSLTKFIDLYRNNKLAENKSVKIKNKNKK